MNSLSTIKRLLRGRHIPLASLGVLGALGLWEAICAFGLVEPLFLPSPLSVLFAIATLFREQEFISDILISVMRIALGFGLSATIALPLGIYLNMSKKGAALLNPLISFIRYIPPSAFIPLFILWFGIGELQKVLLIFAGTAPYLTLLIIDAASSVETVYIESARTLGVHRLGMIFHVVLPRALPAIWDALRLMIGAAWTFVTLAEIVASTAGLGHVIITSQRFLQTANVMAVLFTIGLLGLLTDTGMKVAYRKLFPWVDKTTYAQG